MLTVIKLTYKEILHKRIFHLVLVLTLLFLLLYGLGLNHTSQDIRGDVFVKRMVFCQLTSIGLYMSSFIIAFFSILGSLGLISSEVENGVIQTILVKPIARWELVLGKYIGVAMVLVLYSIFFYVSIIGLNMFFSKGVLTFHLLNITISLCLYSSIPLILLSVSLWGSSFFQTLNNGIMMVMLYAFSTIGGLMEQIGSIADISSLVNIGIFSSLVLPVDAIFRKMSSVLFTGNNGVLFADPRQIMGVSSEPSKWMLIYTLIYVVFFIWRSITVFTKRDI